MAEARKRTRSSAKKAGASFERLISDYEAAHIDHRIDRAPKHGAADRGDIAGLRIHGQRITQECKNTARWTVAEWLKEAEKERQNDGALAGLVVAKRHGIADPGQQVVLMTMNDLIALITGARPDNAIDGGSNDEQVGRGRRDQEVRPAAFGSDHHDDAR